MSTAGQDSPRARRDGLNVQVVGSEILVFDIANDTAHALNRPAAFVWQHADGTRTVDEIAREMGRGALRTGAPGGPWGGSRAGGPWG